MERPRLLWIRVSGTCESAVSRAVADEYFRVEVCPNFELLREHVVRASPDVICWEFEEADATALRAMRDFKLANPSVPLLMLTAQHSEALAVWAFRARVWNYLAKPVSLSELHANFRMLVEVVRVDKESARPVRQLRGLLPQHCTGQPIAEHASALQAAVTHVENNYSERPRQAEVAAAVGMSTSAFSRAFKAEYGLTFSDYQMRFRIGQACLLLRLGTYTATTAGLAVGFDDASHFARAFRRLVGISPSSYKRQRFGARRAKEVYERRRSLLPGSKMRDRRPREQEELARPPKREQWRTRSPDRSR